MAEAAPKNSETIKTKKASELTDNQRTLVMKAYQRADGTLDEEEYIYAQELAQGISQDLIKREQGSDVSNGIAYSDAYVYNQRKGINYSPPKNPEDDREISMGTVHEKIISFCATFLKYVWKRRAKCFDKLGRLIKGLGKIYDLAIEHSYRLEKFSRSIMLIYWEVFTQGNAFVLEDWQVANIPKKKAFTKDKDGNRVEVDMNNMDHTLEFLEGLEYEDDGMIQTRKAVSFLLDGRQVIPGNCEIEETQNQPRMTIEMQWTRPRAKQLFGSLKRWESVPDSTETLQTMVGNDTTLFNSRRLADPKDIVIGHYCFDKINNTYNLMLNGVMMLKRQTTMSVFYPRLNYPLTNIAGERLKGSYYARSVPAKTKFNADALDWVFKMLFEKFEQGAFPAILSNGKYTLSRKMFRGGQITHGVKKSDYDKADPENKGITQSEFSFANMMKGVLEAQTVNATSSGEYDPNATATQISIMDTNQQEKLGALLDGLVIGMSELAERRAETIESKYTTKSRKTLVDGKEVDVYQNFTVQAYGAQNHVIMDASVGTEGFDVQGARDSLFTKAFNGKKTEDVPPEYFLANPIYIAKRNHTVEIEIIPDRRKDTQMQMISFFDEMDRAQKTFNGMINMDTAKEEYLEISNRPDDFFNSKDMEQLAKEQEAALASEQSGGQPVGAGVPSPTKTPTPTKQMLNAQR